MAQLTDDEIWADTEPAPVASVLTHAESATPSIEPATGAAKGPQLAKVLACPGCGTRMEDRRCSRSCPRCGYVDDGSGL